MSDYISKNKVIKGLEFLIKRQHGASCFEEECPYFDRGNGGYLECCKQLAKDAIALIERSPDCDLSGIPEGDGDC